MANPNLHFRLATLQDAVHLQQLVQTAFRAEDSRKDWTADMALGSDYTISVEEIAGQITNPKGGILIAEDDDKNLIGCVATLQPKPDTARFAWLVVDPRLQRGGLGRQILAYAEDHCQRNWAINKFGMNALSSRRLLISWYLRQGYQKTGEQTPFPPEIAKRAGITDDLYFVELEKHLETATVANGTE